MAPCPHHHLIEDGMNAQDTIWSAPEFAVGPYVIREGGLSDREGILETFNRVFAEDNPHFVPRTAREWDWAFADNPAGRQFWVAVAEDGTICSHFAGIPLRVRHPGGEASFSHIVDSFTHPEHRSGLKRPGLFVRTANAFIDCLVWPHRNAILYGFPIPQAFRLGARYVGYEAVRNQLYLSLRDDQEIAPAPGLEVEEIARVDEEVEDLFERSLREDDVMGIRDAAFLDWRYVDHPGQDYAIGAVRSEGRLRGLAVHRPGAFSDLEQGLLMEWLVPPGEDDVARALVAWARERSRAAGLDRLGLLLADADPWWLGLQRLGFRVLSSKYLMVYGDLCRDPRFDEVRLRGHWRYTLGETDLA